MLDPPINPYRYVTLLKHYAWHARDIDGQLALSRSLLILAFEVASKELPDAQELHRQIRRDIAELNHKFGDAQGAIDEYLEINYGFYAGDMLLYQGNFDDAYDAYKAFHASGPFTIHWRLWRCAFLLGRYPDALNYLEEYSKENPKHIVTAQEARTIVLSAQSLGCLNSRVDWDRFRHQYPCCATSLSQKIGGFPTINLHSEKWSQPVELEKFRTKLIRKPKDWDKQRDVNYDQLQLQAIVEKSRRGIWDVPEVDIPTGTTTLIELVKSSRSLEGKTLIEIMPQGFIHPLLLDSHKGLLSACLDQQLEDFKKSNGLDFLSYHRDAILGGFSLYETNDVSQTLKSMLLSAESIVRRQNNLPQRGEGWLSESEMVRMLVSKFAPHKVIRQHSPPWLQGLRFDAYLSDLNLAIEYQGEQHFRPIELFGGETGFVETTARDELKRNLAQLNGTHIEYVTYQQDMNAETTRIAAKYLPITKDRTTQE